MQGAQHALHGPWLPGCAGGEQTVWSVQSEEGRWAEPAGLRGARTGWRPQVTKTDRGHVDGGGVRWLQPCAEGDG